MIRLQHRTLNRRSKADSGLPPRTVFKKVRKVTKPMKKVTKILKRVTKVTFVFRMIYLFDKKNFDNNTTSMYEKPLKYAMNNSKLINIFKKN